VQCAQKGKEHFKGKYNGGYPLWHKHKLIGHTFILPFLAFLKNFLSLLSKTSFCLDCFLAWYWK